MSVLLGGNTSNKYKGLIRTWVLLKVLLSLEAALQAVSPVTWTCFARALFIFMGFKEVLS